MSSGKSPGDDGLPTDFYKEFMDLIAPRLVIVFRDAIIKGTMPESMQSAVITLIHKKGKEAQKCGSYRPVSLINVDAKILAKILALRLEAHLPSLIHPDQVGFIRGRSSADNVRRLLHLIWQVRNSPESVFAFSLDAEKAFDRVEWGYLFRPLSRFGLGSSFIKWVRLLYCNPKASVLTNGNVSPHFTLHRGTRQGCPLSPLIFALALEPLAAAIRDNTTIKGVQAGRMEHKLFLYADDILLLSTNPEATVPQILSLIDTFSHISGYKINWGKSEAMPLSKLCSPRIRENWQFKWLPSGLVYLGIKLTPGLKDIMTENILPLLVKIESTLQNWGKLGMSLLGKINILKMMVFPQINYIIYLLPMGFPPPLLKKFNAVVNTFLWGGKRPRLNRIKICAAKEDGGLNLPRLDWYHYAFSLNQLAKIYITEDQAPGWVLIEKELTEPIPLQAFISQTGGEIPSRNPLLLFARETWQVSHRLIGTNPSFTRKSPIWHNNLLKVDKKVLFGKSWIVAGISFIGDVLEGDDFMSFAQMVSKYRIPKQDFWKYLQLRSCMLSAQRKFPLLPQTELQKILQGNQGTRSSASKFYSLMRQSHPPKLDGLKRAWEGVYRVRYWGRNGQK